MNIPAIAQDFSAAFGRPAEANCFSPGRVNLIGEHIDYNGGRVMPAAISTGSYFAVARNAGKHLNIYLDLFKEKKSIGLSELSGMTATGQWVDFIVGTLLQLKNLHVPLAGADVYVTSDMPQNSGLSSSASFSVGFGFALSDLFGLDLDRVELAPAARAVENDFVGVNCGIMDPFAVAMGKADHCIVLDGDSLDYELLPVNPGEHATQFPRMPG